MQSFLFFDACIYPLLAFGTATLSLIPMIYVFAEYSPTVAPRWVCPSFSIAWDWLADRCHMLPPSLQSGAAA